MSYTKKSKKLPYSTARKKAVHINPRDYTVIGHSAEFMGLHSSHSKSVAQPISHSLEKWILMILLAFAMAAFAGFKLLENSDLSFSITDGSSEVAHKALTPKNDAEFRKQFKKNRAEALSLMQEHKTSIKKNPKYGRGANKLYAQKGSSKSKKLYAAKKASKKKLIAKHKRAKKTLARR